MSYDIYLSHTFQKCLKVLKKKYQHIKDDIVGTIRNLEKNPHIGDPVPGWNKEIWKIRVAENAR